MEPDCSFKKTLTVAVKVKILQVCLLSQDLIWALILLVVNSDLWLGGFLGSTLMMFC